LWKWRNVISLEKQGVKINQPFCVRLLFDCWGKVSGNERFLSNVSQHIRRYEMSLLQETIVYILLIPLFLQIVLPLAMLLIRLCCLPFQSSFKGDAPSGALAAHEIKSMESLA
jgi:hypothetical protein